MGNPPAKPRRLRRLDRIFDSAPSYFLTLCIYGRARVLDNASVFKRARDFAADSLERYGVHVDCYVLMPDHLHLIVTIAPASETTIGEWVKAFKAMVGRRRFKWQSGFFDHLLRSDESRSEKWEYIRMNPVRAGLVEHPDDWPLSDSIVSMVRNCRPDAHIGRSAEWSAVRCAARCAVRTHAG